MRKRKPRSRAEWTKLVAAWQASDLTQQAFAKRKGIAPTTLSWWACRLRREAREAGTLVPVDIVAEAPGACGEFRLQVAGRTVFVPASFDAAALRRVVSVLEGGAC